MYEASPLESKPRPAVRWELSNACYSRPADRIAILDASFNASGSITGIVTISTPDGNNNPTLYFCSVADEGAGHSGAILVGRRGRRLMMRSRKTPGHPTQMNSWC